MKLYDYVLSPSCYKVRLLAALTDTTLTLRPVDFHPGKEHQSPELLTLNPAGSIPILEDGLLVLTESSAILTFIAAQNAPQWLGQDTPQMAAYVQQWLSFSHRLTTTLGSARLIEMLHGHGDLAALQHQGIAALRELEAALVQQHMKGATYLAADRMTIADIACFPYAALAPDGSVSLDPYPKIRLWMRAIRAQPGFIEMPGIHRLHELSNDPLETTNQ